jgi:hypothetical protein
MHREERIKPLELAVTNVCGRAKTEQWVTQPATLRGRLTTKKQKPFHHISRSSTTFSAQLTECFRYLARHFKTNPTETVRSVLG